ncbi:MAG TPA: metalloregulator ArsR/SmtB family transcription factor [Candidatus Acidoferrales bacterium]|nr:metalloregulator ArsR/SmtB family transcription factor [Candidatus Acidoferrales bacterium]
MRHHSVTNGQQDAFAALSDPTRRAVLDLLRRGSRPAGQIAAMFPVSRPAISKHLRLLRRAQLVRERREGRHRVYELNAATLKAVDSWIADYRSFWQKNLASLKNFVESEQSSSERPKRRATAKAKQRRKHGHKSIS